MRRFLNLLIFILFLVISVPVLNYFLDRDPFLISGIRNQSQTAGAGYFSDSIDLDDLQERYENFSNGKNKIENRIKILIVPGHDEEHYGASFNGLREVDLNRQLSKDLKDFLVADTNFRVFLAADENGFNDKIKKYIEEEKIEIQDFRDFKKEVTKRLTDSNKIELENYVSHNSAPEEVALVLYGINRYANEEDFDIVLHVHFNDYPGRNPNLKGEYSGVSIYVPASQFSNGTASYQFAQHLFSRLTKIFPASSNPVERAGVIQDSELIAVGAFNSVDPIALLVEYGYIYEAQFLDEDLRNVVLKELAYQTYIGIKSFFDTEFASSNFSTTILPYDWQNDLKGNESGLDVFALQTLLRIQGEYPPAGNNFKDCPMVGKFGPCTETALKSFQKKYNLVPTGDLDLNTREFLKSFI